MYKTGTKPMLSAPVLLALDFDGVICDGLIEYFQAAWQAYCQIWSMDDEPSEELAQRFYKLRPVIETGWEMPVLVRSLILGETDEQILQRWPEIAQQRVEADQLDPKQVSAAVDGIRDRWIASDLEDWLAQHRFYPGVIERLKTMLDDEQQVYVYIVTTKEERFARQLLAQAGIELSADQVLGKAVKQPKYKTLLDLMQKHDITSADQAWFVEDRLKTLQLVKQQPELQGMGLFLADWGYNIERDRTLAQQDDAIHLLSPERFSQPFSAWLGDQGSTISA